MNEVRIIGVSRASKFSPNCENNDSGIFNAVSHELYLKGFAVSEISETDISELSTSEADLYFSMARDTRALEVLRNKESAGTIIVNSPSSLLFYSRSNITKAFIANGIPLPLSEVLHENDIPSLPFPFWFKRGEACAQSRNDVVFVENADGLYPALKNFKERGISNIVVNEHLVGDLVKFYGVVGTDFFYTYYPTENGKFGKFGLEQINGKIHHYAFNRDKLQEVCNCAGKLLGFTVYGGDCVVDKNGDFKIIDFNDWPSFSCCRGKAANVIANVLQSLARK